MKKTILMLATAIFLMGILAGCRKTIADATVSGNGSGTSTNDVYVAGHEYTVNSNNQIATYWKNGTAVHLSDGTSDAEATAVTVGGTDVYVAGYDDKGGKYWKNGTAVILPNCSYALSIAVNGGDVYVAGFDTSTIAGNNAYNNIAYWKNGKEILLPLPSGDYSGVTTSVAINGNDIYIAGETGGMVMYWKNGAVVPLGVVGNTSNNTSLPNIAVSGGDVYVSGTFNGNGGYWKNGTWMPLLAVPGLNSSPTSMAVSGSNVYFGANVWGYTGYWTNTSVIQLSTKNIVLPTGYTVFDCENISGIAVSGSDVYVAGTVVLHNGNITDYLAVYWKNGTLVQLTQADSDADAIFIK